MSLRKRADKSFERLIKSMTTAELEAIIADGPDLSEFTDYELEQFVHGTASPELNAKYDELQNKFDTKNRQ